MIIKVKARTNSGFQKIEKISDSAYKVYLKSSPEKNKANIELIKILSRHFSSSRKIKITSGLRSRKKTIEVK